MDFALKQPKIDKEFFEKDVRIKGSKGTNPVIKTKIPPIKVDC